MNAERSQTFSRRDLLTHSSMGFGATVLAAMFGRQTIAAEDTSLQSPLPHNAGLKRLHHAAKAKHVIFCFMSGGVSHVDTFDPKPTLSRLNGQPMPTSVARTQFNNNGNVMASPFDFIKRGEISLIINTPLGRVSHYDEQAIRKAALQFNVPCVTTITGAEALIEAIATKKSQLKLSVRSLQEIHNKKQLTAEESR